MEATKDRATASFRNVPQTLSQDTIALLRQLDADDTKWVIEYMKIHLAQIHSSPKHSRKARFRINETVISDEEWLQTAGDMPNTDFPEITEEEFIMANKNKSIRQAEKWL